MATALPSNRAPFSVDEVLAVTGGVLVRRGSELPAVGVCTDTRKLQAGNLFVALRGPTFDGHAFLQTAHAQGASMFLLSQHVTAPGEGSVIRVPDTLIALGLLGKAHRQRWARDARKTGRKAEVVAITGSAGKTTTSRAVTAALGAIAPNAVHSPLGNLNNQVGVPVVLLGLESRHRFAVVEIGTNSRGEIAYGASLAEPDVGVLTLVSCAHGEGIGTLEDIAHEKGFLLEAVGAQGVAVANADDPRARAQMLRSRAQSFLTYGSDSAADVRLVAREPQDLSAQKIVFEVAGKKLEVATPLLGEAGAYAAGAALAVCLAVTDGKADLAAVAQALGAMQAEEGRLRPRQLDSGLVVIDDAYNANPASMAASIRAASELAGKMGRPLVLVLGEMRELGMQSRQEHERLGAVAQQSGAVRILAVTGAARLLADAAAACGANTQYAEDSAAAATMIREGLTGNEVVLVKGSRGVALERVVAALEAEGQKGSA
ncbi:MAG: UDP-N-acetylmuramoyl-tripeptide--D-alanyl-D-alanine ligase [Deltaproteobacteria bacterium]|nr:UDP-N-acetylmuramoyl-tripeptide--D-alanyl-D-alanine ligase [Deltaproteobacteria bacterium]